jgi:hypothetical protein
VQGLSCRSPDEKPELISLFGLLEAQLLQYELPAGPSLEPHATRVFCIVRLEARLSFLCCRRCNSCKSRRTLDS